MLPCQRQLTRGVSHKITVLRQELLCNFKSCFFQILKIMNICIFKTRLAKALITLVEVPC